MKKLFDNYINEATASQSMIDEIEPNLYKSIKKKWSNWKDMKGAL